MRSIVAALLVLSGLGVAGWVVVDDTGDDVGEVTVEAGSLPTADDTPTEPAPTPDATERDDEPTAAETPTTAPAAAAPEIGRSSARLGDVDLSRPTPPADIQLPSIGVDAPVVPVGIEPDGLMTVPEDVDTVGWYQWGGTPGGDTGTTVLAGHVDSRSQGRGAFFDLRAMGVGDEVSVTDADGATTTWRVVGRRTFDKASLPVDELYRRDGQPRLVLITCGGDFDADVRSYESNVVVEAEPVA